MRIKNIVLLTFMCLICSVSFSSSYGNISPYMAGHLGIALLEDATLSEPGFTSVDMEFDPGLGLDVAVGNDFGAFRIEGELTYRTNDIDQFTTRGVELEADGDVTALSLMLNAFLDVENETPFTPYIGGGLGFASVSMNDVKVSGIAVNDEDDTVVAYQIGFGVEYAVSEKISLDVGYRYYATDDPDFDGTNVEYTSHNVILGVRVSY